MKTNTLYTVELDWFDMNTIIKKNDFGYLEYATKQLVIWCETTFTDDKSRWRYYSYNNMMESITVFAFCHESDRTMFLLKWA